MLFFFDCSVVILQEAQYECFTVFQCALLFVAHFEDNIEDLDETICTYYTLAMLDIAKGELEALHPETSLPVSQYFRLIAAGIYGDDGSDAPMAHPGYLVKLNECKRWFDTKGIHFDFTKLKSDLDAMQVESGNNTSTLKTSKQNPLDPAVTNTEPVTKKVYADWILSARKIGMHIYEKTPYLSIEQIALPPIIQMSHFYVMRPLV